MGNKIEILSKINTVKNTRTLIKTPLTINNRVAKRPPAMKTSRAGKKLTGKKVDIESKPRTSIKPASSKTTYGEKNRFYTNNPYTEKGHSANKNLQQKSSSRRKTPYGEKHKSSKQHAYDETARSARERLQQKSSLWREKLMRKKTPSK